MTFEELYAVDKANMFRLLKDFPAQVGDALAIGKKFRPGKKPAGIRQIVLTGMGGSAIGGDLLHDYLSGELSVPFVVNRDYTLPSFVGRETLVVVSSYSGNTEETLNAYREAIKRRAKILCITSGGKIGKLAAAKRHMLITVPGGFPPRAALGYSFFPILLALTAFGLVRNKAREIEETVRHLSAKSQEYGVPDPSGNRAMQLAGFLQGRLSLVYAGSEHLGSVATRWRSQVAENAKSLMSSHVLPEMNHNEVVGWQIPEDTLRETLVILLRDRGDHKRVQKRMELTRQLLSERTPNVAEVWSEGKGLLARMFSLVYLADWTSYYLAVLNSVDPTPVVVIDQLKSELGRT
jgi:glucose/mannose-6-phosphate isomerase